jgi:hypothetical protein
MFCSFCRKKGHENYFCPSTPYRPSKPEHRIEFVDRLMAAPRVKTNVFAGKPLDLALDEIIAQGTCLNKANPWVGSDLVYDQLRAKLGFWRAVGASDSVISYIGYGVPMRFQREPSHLVFENHKMGADEASYVDSDMKKRLERNCFRPARPGEVKVSNPILVVHQNGKLRRCDDARYVNAYAKREARRPTSRGCW